MPIAASDPRRAEQSLDQGLLTATAALRWAAWVWMTVVVAIDLRNGGIAHPAAMVGAVGATLVVTAVDTVMVRVNSEHLLSLPMLAVELAIGMSLLFLDHWVYGPDVGHAQSLGSVWPLAGVISIGIRFGGSGGLVAGMLIGLSAWVGDLVFVSGRWSGDRTLGAIGTTVLYSLGGAVAGFTATRLRRAEREIASARAREEVARTLHDGVLQTLAVVQRRSDDPELERLARDQELALRRYLFGDGRDTAAGGDGSAEEITSTDLLDSLRGVAQHVEHRENLRIDVVATQDLQGSIDSGTVQAVAGAVRECLTNASKHGEATRATVFVDVEAGPHGQSGVSCSVKDDGRGFEPGVPEGIGITRSIRGRIDDVRGTVDIDGRPGNGTEVRIWVPMESPITAVGSALSSRSARLRW